MRNYEKVYASILQLGSVAEHLKDLVGLAKLDQFKSNAEHIQEYIECNLENTIFQLIKTLHQSSITARESTNQKLVHKGTLQRPHQDYSVEHVDSESTFEGDMTLKNLKFDPEKINVRANNFKKFRQSTQDLIKQLFEHQLESKCQIVKQLESQVTQQAEDNRRELKSKDN